MSETPSVVAFIPARAGSKRIPKKNIKMINDHPLIAYTIKTALDSGVFSEVIVSTDTEEIAEVARQYGASVPVLRPVELAGSESPDIEWVMHMRAWSTFLNNQPADSLRAVEKCSQHPAKMWTISSDGRSMSPVLVNPDATDVPWHSKQYPSLPLIYVQNASLEIAWTTVATSGRGIAGTHIIPFVSEGYEGFDLNFEEDWVVLEYLIANGRVSLPTF
jgi:CMP-N,N'-diacetyllegionaminic acid synthase